MLAVKSLSPNAEAAAFAARAIQPLQRARWPTRSICSSPSAPCAGTTRLLTALGAHLVSLPVAPRLGKMLVVAAALGQLEPALTVAAATATRALLRPAAGCEARGGRVAPRLRRGRRQRPRRHRARLKSGGACLRNGARARRARFAASAFVPRRARARRRGAGTAPVVVADRGVRASRAVRGLGRFIVRVGRRGVPSRGVRRLVPKNRRRVQTGAPRRAEDARGRPRGVPPRVGQRAARRVVPLPPWVAYGEKVKTGAVYLRDSTCVPACAVLLLGGELEAAPLERDAENEKTKTSDERVRADDRTREDQTLDRVRVLNGAYAFVAPSATLDAIKRLRKRAGRGAPRKSREPRRRRRGARRGAGGGGAGADGGRGARLRARGCGAFKSEGLAVSARVRSGVCGEEEVLQMRRGEAGGARRRDARHDTNAFFFFFFSIRFVFTGYVHVEVGCARCL